MSEYALGQGLKVTIYRILKETTYRMKLQDAQSQTAWLYIKSELAGQAEALRIIIPLILMLREIK